VVARAFSIPSGGTLSQGSAGKAAGSAYSFSLNKNGVSFGTVNFAASATTATFTVASATSFAAGDVISIVAAASPDVSIADIAITLAAA
jgi:hypothetical protein